MLEGGGGALPSVEIILKFDLKNKIRIYNALNTNSLVRIKYKGFFFSQSNATKTAKATYV